MPFDINTYHTYSCGSRRTHPSMIMQYHEVILFIQLLLKQSQFQSESSQFISSTFIKCLFMKDRVAKNCEFHLQYIWTQLSEIAKIIPITNFFEYIFSIISDQRILINRTKIELLKSVHF